MSFFSRLKIELILFFLLILIVFTSLRPDIAINNFVLRLIDNDRGNYLKEFFVQITELGSSAWYFGIALFFLALLLINKKINLLKIEDTNNQIRFWFSSIVYLTLVGIITQIFKHIIGRPRPNYTDLESGFVNNFFTFESNFHSFPSGHSSTIFMVCFIMCSIMPKLKYYFFALTCIIAFSRVVVGAHFITDVFAGGLLALIIFRFLNIFLEKNINKYSFFKFNFEKNNDLLNYIVVLLGLCLFLTVSPTLDLYISSIFYIDKSQFYLQSFHLLSLFFREILIPIILIYILVFPLLSKYMSNIFFGYRFSINEILLIWFSQILSLIVIVNLLFKNLWGRSRPGDILEFGGKDIFTPWYKIGEVCQTNCSFVSGDASVGFGIIILYLITKNIFFLHASLICGIGLGIIRIMAGGHFLSDILFAALLVFLFNIIFFQIYKKYYVK